MKISGIMANWHLGSVSPHVSIGSWGSSVNIVTRLWGG